MNIKDPTRPSEFWQRSWGKDAYYCIVCSTSASLWEMTVSQDKRAHHESSPLDNQEVECGDGKNLARFLQKTLTGFINKPYLSS